MNLFELFVKIGADSTDFESALTENLAKTKSFGDTVKSGLGTVAKAGFVGLATATTAAAGAIAGLTTQAVKGYAETEQLVGGVDTLFKESSSQIQQYANEAFQTAGMSANQYMETVTSFSASLIQSLEGDTAKAAETADQAIRDMSDNANKMGTDISMIQNAYQGFAKQNYTMLDNLKLGYGGTKEEMERLLEDAEKISGIEYDISSFADITAAIHVMQEEMGIAGATAAEASGTVEGSVNAMKAAWTNLAIGFADENANIDVLMDNFLNSVETVADNVLPIVTRVLESIFETLKERGPEMVKSGAALLGKLATGAIEAIPSIIASIPLIIESIVGGFVDAWPQMVEVGKDLIRGVWEGIQSLAGWLGEKVTNFVNSLFDKKSNNISGTEKNVSSGLDRGVSTMDFADSGIGKSSASIINASSGSRGGGVTAVDLTLKSDDGQNFGRWMVPFVRSENRSNPEVVSDS